MLGSDLTRVLLQRCLNHAVCRSMQESSKPHGGEKLSLLAAALLEGSELPGPGGRSKSGQ